MSHIFISYSRKDKKVVGDYIESLRKQDFIVWQDVSNISAGDKWNQALLDAIEQSSAVIVFWSQAASLSDYVNQEIDYALTHNKLIIPVWLEVATPLRDGLKEANAVISPVYSNSSVQKIIHALLDKAPRLQRKVADFNTSIPMNSQSLEGIKREVIGHREYVIVPLIMSTYSNACVIAEAGTIVRNVRRIQLIVQNTGPIDYSAVRDALNTVTESDLEYPEGAEPLVGLYVTGAPDPTKKSVYWIDKNNVAHFSDMVETTRIAIAEITKNAVEKQMLQLFQKTLVEISFLLGVTIERWRSVQLYKMDGDRYIKVLNIPPRQP